MPVSQQIQYQSRRISINLTNVRHRNQLNYNNHSPPIRNKSYALQKPFETDFLTVIGNAKLWPSFVICWWAAQGSRPRCGPRHPIFHSNIFFYGKLFATIIISWNSLKCSLYYLLELSDPFIKNDSHDPSLSLKLCSSASGFSLCASGLGVIVMLIKQVAEKFRAVNNASFLSQFCKVSECQLFARVVFYTM